MTGGDESSGDRTKVQIAESRLGRTPDHSDSGPLGSKCSVRLFASTCPPCLAKPSSVPDRDLKSAHQTAKQIHAVIESPFPARAGRSGSAERSANAPTIAGGTRHTRIRRTSQAKCSGYCPSRPRQRVTRRLPLEDPRTTTSAMTTRWRRPRRPRPPRSIATGEGSRRFRQTFRGVSWLSPCYPPPGMISIWRTTMAPGGVAADAVVGRGDIGSGARQGSGERWRAPAVV